MGLAVLLHLFRWSGSRDPLGSAFTAALAELLSGRSWLVLVLLSISASPSSLSVCDALLCACSSTGQHTMHLVQHMPCMTPTHGIQTYQGGVAF